jgi:hypothetical protein
MNKITFTSGTFKSNSTREVLKGFWIAEYNGIKVCGLTRTEAHDKLVAAMQSGRRTA